MSEHLIKTRYRVIMPARCPECGAPVPSFFDHIDQDCPAEEMRPQREFEVMWPRDPGYDRLMAVVPPLMVGATIERVSVLADFDRGSNFNQTDMFVDESGRAKGLPRNEAATVIYRRATLCGRTGAPVVTDPETLPFIVGPAVLFSRRVWF